MTSRVVLHTQHDRWRVTFYEDGRDPFVETWDAGAGWMKWEVLKDRIDNRLLEARIVERAKALRL